jgi:hypothetical protein
MSEAVMGGKPAIGSRQLAIGQRVFVANPAGLALPLPVAYRPLPIASSDIANSCTVTACGTSVTNLPLADSVLIGVGKLALELEPEKHVWPTFTLAARVPRCSFKWGRCIQ